MYKQPEKLNPIQQFQLFCLESYRSAKGVSGMIALNDFKKAGVFSFLSSGYEVLHTQGQSFIVSEINRFINRHHEALPRKH